MAWPPLPISHSHALQLTEVGKWMTNNGGDQRYELPRYHSLPCLGPPQDWTPRGTYVDSHVPLGCVVCLFPHNRATRGPASAMADHHSLGPSIASVAAMSSF